MDECSSSSASWWIASRREDSAPDIEAATLEGIAPPLGGGPGRLASSEAVGLPGRPGATPAWPEGDFPAHINLADSSESRTA